MIIFKQALLSETGIAVLELPFQTANEARDNILKIALQNGSPYIWYNALDKPHKSFILVCIGTGHDHPEFDLKDYVGTVVMESGYVWHYLLLDSPDEGER